MVIKLDMTKDQHKSTLIRTPAPIVEPIKDLLTLYREGNQEAVLQSLRELVTNLKQGGYQVVTSGYHRSKQSRICKR